MAEKEPDKKTRSRESKRTAMYDHGKSKEKAKDKEDEREGEDDHEKSPEKEKKPESGGDKHHKAMKEMAKRHETERRDLHASHREDHRKMQGRHEKEAADLMNQQVVGQPGAEGTEATDNAPEGEP